MQNFLRPKFSIAFVITLLALMSIALASPTTQPSTKPSTPPGKKRVTAGKDFKLYKSDALGFQFLVPKDWKAAQADAIDGRFAFELPTSKNRSSGSSAKKQKQASPADDYTEARLSIGGGQPCHGDPTLEAQVASVRDGKNMDGTTPKLIKDEPYDLNGVPARRFTVENISKITMTSSNAPPVQFEVKTIQQHVLAVRDNKLFDLMLDCDAKTYESKTKHFENVVNSFEWIKNPESSEKKS
jgi:hypothetical protein